jgi:hypothetical protein
LIAGSVAGTLAVSDMRIFYSLCFVLVNSTHTIRRARRIGIGPIIRAEAKFELHVV